MKRPPKSPAASRGSTGCESKRPMKVTSRPFDPAVALREAVALHQQGQLREAERIYTRLLKAAPDGFDALNLLGGIKMQQGQIRGSQPRGAISARRSTRSSARLKRCKAWTRLARLRRTISTFSISMPTCS